MLRPQSLFALLPLAFASLLTGQGSRTVLEPFFPPICGYVDAQIQATNGDPGMVGDQGIDTARLQKAIDRCGKGRALVLRVDEARNAFVTGPLILRPDITLIVSRGIYLLAATDPRQFDVTPGSCGKVNGVASGCKPLITIDHATGDGIMGDGFLDGRGVVSRLISVDYSNNFTLYRINLRNETGLTLTFDHGSGLTLWGVHVKAAAGAIDAKGGIAIGSAARNVATAQSYVETGAGPTEIVLDRAQ
jgi:polygalacturonase